MNTSQDSLYKLYIKNIQKDFDSVKVVDDITIAIEPGEFVSLLGPSGSGKTTLFNIIAGLIVPDRGEIIIDGKNYTGKTGRVSYMYQKDMLLPWMSIIDNVCMPLIIKGQSKKKAREKASELIFDFGLFGYEDKYPNQLSGGMRQRAALLRTYLFSNDIMLLDEPFGALDAINRAKMQDWLLRLWSKMHNCILFITHDIDEAIYLSDKVYVLTERPAAILEEINIKLKRPRDMKLITMTEFNNIKNHILDIMQFE